MASNTYLAVKAMDMTRERSLDQVIQDLPQWEEIPPEIETPACADYLIGNSYQKKAEAGFVAPYSIYPLPASYASGLITGYLRVRTQLNTAALTKALQEAGFETDCLLQRYRLPGQSSSELAGRADYFRLRRGAITILISGQPLGQILFEGLPLEDFVASVVDNYEALRARKAIIVPGSSFGGMHRSNALSTYTNMEQVWRTSRDFVEPYEDDGSHSSHCS